MHLQVIDRLWTSKYMNRGKFATKKDYLHAVKTERVYRDEMLAAKQTYIEQKRACSGDNRVVLHPTCIGCSIDVI